MKALSEKTLYTDTPTGIFLNWKGPRQRRGGSAVLCFRDENSAKGGYKTMIIRKVSQAALSIARFIEAFFEVEPLYRSH
jgi:hypothetical protein